MRYDVIIPRLKPLAQYAFGTIEEMRLSILPGDSEPVLRPEQISVFDDYSKIIWLDEVITQPTLQECETEWALILAERDNEEIDEKRIAEYGGVGEQLDMIYWDTMNGTTTWLDHVTAVKDANPKT